MFYKLPAEATEELLKSYCIPITEGLINAFLKILG